jgi:hypothetical protein
MLRARKHAHQISPLMPEQADSIVLSTLRLLLARHNEASRGALELEARSGIEPLYAALQAAA